MICEEEMHSWNRKYQIVLKLNIFKKTNSEYIWVIGINSELFHIDIF